MSEESRDLVKDGVSRIFDEAEILVLVEGAQAVGRTAPRLSDEDIKKIADRVADQVAVQFADKIPAEKKGQWKKTFARVAYDLGIGIGGSALYELLCFLAHHFAYQDSAYDEALRERKRRREQSLKRLFERVPPEIAPQFEHLAKTPFLAHLVIKEMEKSVSAGGATRELEQPVIDAIGGPPAGYAESGLGWVGRRLVLDMFYALEEEAAARAGEPMVT